MSIGKDAKSNTPFSKSIDSLFHKSEDIMYVEIDNALNNFQICLAYYEDTKDTVNIIKSKSVLIQMYAGMGKYLEAYDLAWSLLPLVEKIQYTESKVKIYHRLASLYLLFEQYDNATRYYHEAIILVDSLISDPSKKANLLGNLYDFKAWLISESSRNYEEAEKYLLKSIAQFESADKEYGVLFGKLHLGKLYIYLNKLKEAKVILFKIQDQYLHVQNPIHSLLYEHIGRLYLEENKVDSAILYFEKSIEAIAIHRNHLDNKVKILGILAKEYSKKGEMDIAFNYLEKSKELGDSLFGSQSSQNRAIFEIKDKYSAQLKRKEDEIKNQKLAILVHEKELWLLKTIIIFTTFGLIILAIYAYYKKQVRKQKLEKSLLKEKQALEHQKQAEVLEIKNKELMASALKLIERDTLMDDIKNQLGILQKQGVKSKIIKQVTQSININKSKNWDEFELYFTSVNNNYNKLLRTKHPKLTLTDQKMCAFIKLGFSSKDVAHIMGLGVAGVNTSRSRIRKKMDLDRSINLNDYLQSIAADTKS